MVWKTLTERNDNMNLGLMIRDNKVIVSSRDIAAAYGKQHKHVLESIDSLLEKHPELGGSNFRLTQYEDVQGKDQRSYDMDRQGFSILVNKFTGDKALAFTIKYTEAFEKMASSIPQQVIPTGVNLLALAVLEAQKMLQKDAFIEQQQTRIEMDKPKVIFADAVSVSKTSILVGDLAKILKQNGIDTGAVRFFEWLRLHGYLIKRRGTDYNMPTQVSMNLELFEIKETTISHSDGHTTINKTPKVTGKGQVYFVNKLKEA